MQDGTGLLTMTRRRRRITDLEDYPHEWVSLAAIRDYIGIDRRTLNKWITLGGLQVYDFEGVRRVRKADILAFIEKARVRKAG